MQAPPAAGRPGLPTAAAAASEPGSSAELVAAKLTAEGALTSVPPEMHPVGTVVTVTD